jgi:hypothetical protein
MLEAVVYDLAEAKSAMWTAMGLGVHSSTYAWNSRFSPRSLYSSGAIWTVIVFLAFRETKVQ